MPIDRTDDFLRTLIVATDGSPRCEPAILAGLELADRFGATVELLHVVPVPSPPWQGVDSQRLAAIAGEALTAAREQVAASVRALLERSGRASLTIEELLRVSPGNPAQVLLERIDARQADLVVLGPHEKRGLFDFGSTTRALLSNARRAVWVQPGDFREPRRILVPVDLSHHSMLALGQARTLAERLDASIETLHCFARPEFAIAQVMTSSAPDPEHVVQQVREAARREYERTMKAFDWRAVRHAHDFRDGEPVGTILEKSEGADLVVMGTHGRTGLSASVLGNVAYGVLRDSGVPVLAIRHPEREWLRA